ncbi:DUF4445 domain-containing protein [Thermosulfurimonas marina]|uniref:DUF4445 domain-containing protein n=1 Tax=Thermosulfurimonas marina TaxID=2047767 RepID=A0A6H1WUJ5_9BACT|nr:ASKHA domain-containing protein [Thermosulfurimonas marina]QJA06872.1 DUF4445 domain-containing protein [Thermosulfurimonas marina]
MRAVAEKISLFLPPPSLSDQRADERRLREALSEVLGEAPEIPLSVLKKLPETLRAGDFQVATVVGKREQSWEVLEVWPRKGPEPLGLAIDLGSTGVVLYLVDLSRKEVLAKRSFRNPQIPYGEDILTRLHFASKPEGLEELRRITLEGLSEEIRKLLGPEVSRVFYYALCGNTTMTHFLLGLPTRWLYREPYIPAANWLDVLKAREVGLPGHPEALIFLFPSGGSYFGGDLLAGLYYVELLRKEGLALFVDVGTNAEVVLGNRDFLLACAGAAGPALEGGILSCGMQAAPGAIERVRWEEGKFVYQTIGGEKPRGICGSGAIDLLAALFLSGLLSPEGVFRPEKAPEHFREIKGELAFILADEKETAHGKPLYLTQGEVKNLIRSKGAMFTILRVICENLGVTFDDIEEIFIAGSFGNHIDPESAVTIGMLPDLPRERFRPVGNAAGKGAVKFLLEGGFQELREILRRLTYLEMNVENRFMQLLTGALFLPHTDLDLFPSVKEKVARNA